MGPSHNKANYYLTDQVSCLTDCRDRDVLDQTLARVLLELFSPLSVTLYMIMVYLQSFLKKSINSASPSTRSRSPSGPILAFLIRAVGSAST